jgi:hypothetical protein
VKSRRRSSAIFDRASAGKHQRLGAAVRGGGEQFEGAAAVGLGAAIFYRLREGRCNKLVFRNPKVPPGWGSSDGRKCLQLIDPWPRQASAARPSTTCKPATCRGSRQPNPLRVLDFELSRDKRGANLHVGRRLVLRDLRKCGGCASGCNAAQTNDRRVQGQATAASGTNMVVDNSEHSIVLTPTGWGMEVASCPARSQNRS